MLRIKDIKISINDNTEEHIKSKVSKLIKQDVIGYKIVKRSIDARDSNNMLFIYTLDITVKDEKKVKLGNNISITPDETYSFKEFGNNKLNYRPIVIGAGPSGLFCAYILAEYGYKPIVFERGEDVDNRIKSVDEFFRSNKLNNESNIQFEKELTFYPKYHGKQMKTHYRVDFLCKGDVIVECKSVEELNNNHRAQLYNYMRLLNLPCGILVNFAPKNVDIQRYFYDTEKRDILDVYGRLVHKYRR